MMDSHFASLFPLSLRAGNIKTFCHLLPRVEWRHVSNLYRAPNVELQLFFGDPEAQY